jgi:hypothetical protein
VLPLLVKRMAAVKPLPHSFTTTWLQLNAPPLELLEEELLLDELEELELDELVSINPTQRPLTTDIILSPVQATSRCDRLS